MSATASDPSSTTPQPRQLLIMRHAKAAYPDDCTDHERPLAPRGQKDAQGVGQWLAESDLVPQVVLCSDAVRTRETTQNVLEGAAAAGVTVHTLSSLYEAHVGEVLDAVHELDPRVSRALIVGHEPTMSATVASLTGQYPRFTTAALAVLEFSGEWTDLEPDACSLDQFRTPKDA